MLLNFALRSPFSRGHRVEMRKPWQEVGSAHFFPSIGSQFLSRAVTMNSDHHLLITGAPVGPKDWGSISTAAEASAAAEIVMLERLVYHSPPGGFPGAGLRIVFRHGMRV